MSIEFTEAVSHCREKLNTGPNGSVKTLIGRLVYRYQKVIDGEGTVDEARDWYLAASDAYETFRQRGDNVARYLAALQHTYLYCEERLRELLEDR